MKRALVRSLLTCGLVLAAACHDSGGADAATLHHTAAGSAFLRVAIVAQPLDSRLPVVREAIAHWNAEFARLGLTVHLDSGTLYSNPVSDSVARAASGEVKHLRRPATNRLRASVASLPADIVVVLSNTDLISFGLPWSAGSQGIVVLRRSDVSPLSLPNTLRNVAAHELGHALGLEHNSDSTTLMCGRPTPCRPATFASDRSHFFPLTPRDDAGLRKRWP